MEAEFQSTAMADDHEVVKCVECQFVMGGGATFCSRCGYNIRDSKPNYRSNSNSSNTASNPSAQVTPVTELRSRGSQNIEVGNVLRLV